RTAPIGPRSMAVVGGSGFEPVQARRMTREDFRNVRRWHRQAARRLAIGQGNKGVQHGAGGAERHPGDSDPVEA
ncbi:MAG: hypothetical protein ACLGIK_03375, partial [Gemmatimonadota bacterium]